MVKKKIQDERVQEVKRLINLNEDSRQYFYEKADENWLKWLWENGFFDVLKKKAKDPIKFSYKNPELRYLVRMAEINPELVIEIMLDIPISKDTFNPEVIDQFLHICSHLPGEQLVKMVGKIKAEKWPVLMQNYNQWSIDYGKMFESLEKSNYYDELIDLASTILEFRDDWEINIKDEYLDISPFYIKKISYSKVFYYLSTIDEKHIQCVLDLSLSILKRFIIFQEEDFESSNVFKQVDKIPLYGLDIFTLEINPKYQESTHNDIRELVALIKTLSKRLLEQKCKEKAIAFYEKNFKSLPDSWLMWRIRLYIMSLCPSELMPYLKETLFRIFQEDRYSTLIMGAEYKKTLAKVFPIMSKTDRSTFINLAKDFFSIESNKENIYYKKRDGSYIFSVIREYLTDEQVDEIVNAGFKIIPGYVPTPAVPMSEVGFVKAKGPVTQEKLQNISISNIITNLKNIWSPAQLIKQDVQKDFLNPLNAKGMGDLLKGDVKIRLQEYLKYCDEFLDLKNLDMHYLYSLLSGFVVASDENAELFRNEDWEVLINFCVQIVQLGKQSPSMKLKYEINKNDVWLGRWNAVCNAMINLLKNILKVNGEKLGIKKGIYRQKMLSIIEYLFNYPDPLPEDEKIESAKITETAGDQQLLVSDPFTLAINSIRGQAFELFILVIENLEEKKENSYGVNKLSTIFTEVYEKLIEKEKTRAIMFMFGHYLPFFFYRDKNWVKSILNKIFPTDEEKKYLCLAAWEGYLTNNLYLEIFEEKDFQKLYKKAIVMTVNDYPNQRHFTDPEKGIARHLALAYMVIDFTFGDELFDYFWTEGNIKQHTAFVDMLGRSFISSENPRALKLVSEDKNAREKIKDMWCWLLENYSDPSVFNGIGFWINLDKKIFNANELASYLAKTLVKTGGYLEWDVGLRDNIVALAKSSPEDTVEIARLFLLEGGVRKGTNSLYFFLDEKWIETFRILYRLSMTKQKTIDLINDLILEGGRYFWSLKKVLENS